MKNTDFIIITQSETVNYSEYSNLPIERIELYSDLVFGRMLYYKKGFHSHMDIINSFRSGTFFQDADYPARRNLLNIWNLPSMCGIHLADYLSTCGITTKVINNFDSEWDILCKSYEMCEIPPLIGISTTFYLSYTEVHRITKKIRERYPSAEIVLGGAFVNERAINGSLEDFEKPMRKYSIGYILHAFNSESDLRDLILARKKNTDIGNVRNLVYIENGDFTNGIYNINSSVWNAPVLEGMSEGQNSLYTEYINHTVQMRTSSGCPFSCAFCSYPKTAKKFYTMAIPDVEKNIQHALRVDGVNKIIFIDDTFNASALRFKEICRLFCKYNFEWFSFLRAQFLDEEAAKLMKDSGCIGVYLGIESANDFVLKNMNKNATRSQFIKGLNLLKKYGITTMAAFIIGFPGETEDSIKNDIEFIETTGIDFYTLKEFYYMKHTDIHENREKFGLSGLGSNWKHNTMDYKTASLKKKEMFKNIKNSVFVDPDTSLWYLAYLYDQGYSMDSITTIQKEINSITMDQMNGVYDDNHRGFRNLRGIFSRETISQ